MSELDRRLAGLAADVPPAPEDFHARWTEAVRREAGGARGRTSVLRFGWRRAAGIAAALILLVGGTVAFRMQRQGEKQQAAPALQAVQSKGGVPAGEEILPAEEEAAEMDRAAEADLDQGDAFVLTGAGAVRNDAAVLRSEEAAETAETEEAAEAAGAAEMEEAAEAAEPMETAEPAETTAPETSAEAAKTDAAAEASGRTEAAQPPVWPWIAGAAALILGAGLAAWIRRSRR